MKNNRSLIVSLIALAVFVAGFVPVFQSYKSSNRTAQAAEAVKAEQLSVSSLDRFGHNLTGEFVPGRVEPELSSSPSITFDGRAIPYQAKPWLALQESSRNVRQEPISHYALPWLALQESSRNVKQEPISHYAKPWLSPVDQFARNMSGEFVPGHLNNNSAEWMSPVDRYARRLNGEFVPGHLDNIAK
jgi:hypothetical protein